MTDWTGFYKKTIEERQNLLAQANLLSSEHLETLSEDKQLDLATADQLVENVIGRFSLPFSLVPNVLVNGKTYQVPYVTEEPSVVAAASNAAKLFAANGGCQVKIHNRLMIGQVALYDVPDFDKARADILAQKARIIELANQAHPSIVKRGGGARELTVEVIDNSRPFLVLYLTVDTQEAMGANMVNTMLEAIAPLAETITGGKKLMAILSNYATESLVTASCQLDIDSLAKDRTTATALSERIVLASQFAQADPYRAATHNKGIFNGIDALLLATGNDWRAIEAGGHAYASQDGSYRGLSTWTLDDDKKILKGELTLPLPVASKGGSIGINPTVQLAHELLGQPTARELAAIIASCGLAQNFAALKALVSTGIQAGHMKLHAKSLALLAGASPQQVDQVVAQLLKADHLNLETAQSILTGLN